MATCLYTAVITDTGSFHYAGTDASTFALAEYLVEAGADPMRIAQDVFCSQSPARVRILGAALGRIQIELPFAWTSITLADIERSGGNVEDSEGIVNHLIAIAGVEAAAFFREVVPGQECRISLRCTFAGPLAEATDRVVDALRAVSSPPVAAENLLA
jgi:phosphoesterase RecJ-like protein